MILYRLPQFTSQLRTQFARNAWRTCILIPNRSFTRMLPVNTIELYSEEDSTITGVSVYPSRAEITRLFELNVATGQNQLNISGLPATLDRDSLRIEGRDHSAATIHGVTISENDPPTPESSDTLKDLLEEKSRIEDARIRAKIIRTRLGEYLGSLKIKPTQDLCDELDKYESAAEDQDQQNKHLKDELADTDEEIKDEKERLLNPEENPNLNVKVSIGVLADFEGTINIALIYAVYEHSSVKWNPWYDIRVDTKKKNKPVTLTYQACITQETGEDWDNVPLTLETATPTFGLEVPALTPWNISFDRQLPMKSKPLTNASSFSHGAAPNQKHYMDVSSTGNVSATFQVPGLVSIPSKKSFHKVTIAKVDLDAKMSWLCVPKKGAKTYLNAKIKNASPYTFLSGQSSVNVDGRVISKSDVPLVGPGESFDCPLDVDPSIQIIYHPRSKKVIQSGIFNKTTNHMFSQRITIANTKTLPIENLKIIDQVPVSENSEITVKLDRPALRVPGEGFGCGGEPKVPPPVSVALGVVGQWHGADEAGVEVEALGKDGKLNWICAVPAQEKIGLVLQWEVVTPVKTAILGLTS